MQEDLKPTTYFLPGNANPTGSSFPVIAYNNFVFFKDSNSGTTEDSKATEVRNFLSKIKECGFNATIWSPEEINGTYWTSLNTLYYSKASGNQLPTILEIPDIAPVVTQKLVQISGGALSLGGWPTGRMFGPEPLHYENPTPEEYAEILNRDAGNANLWGYLLKNKPKFANWGYDFVTMPIGMKDLQEAYRIFMQNNNGHVAFLNLAAERTAENIGDELTAPDLGKNDKERYELYLSEIQEKFTPQLMSVDLSPIIAAGDDPTNRIKWDYYFTLEAIGNVSKVTKVPFWLNILCSQYTVYDVPEPDGTDDSSSTPVVKEKYPVVTEGMLRYQALTAIAHGIQGLVFGSYAPFTNEYNESNELIKEFGIAPVDSNGQTTEVWNACKAVIPEIKAFGQKLLGFHFQSAMHIYGPSGIRIYYPGGDERSLTFPLTRNFYVICGCVTGAHVVGGKGRGFVITDLSKAIGEKKYDQYVAVVSHDFESEQDIYLSMPPSFKITVFEYENGNLVETYNSSNNERTTNDTVITKTLKPGGMLLIKYN